MAYRDLERGADKEAWSTAPTELSRDKLEIDGHPVMEAWEQAYMAALAAVATRNGGRILEVGFGLGLSALAIQQHDITEHVILEANLEVFKRLCTFAEKAGHPVRPIQGLWEEVLGTLQTGSFDGILYDTYPLNAESQHDHQFDFLRQARRLLRPGGIVTYCNLTSLGVLRGEHECWDALFEQTQRPHILAAGYRETEIEGYTLFPVSPPADCRYYRFEER